MSDLDIKQAPSLPATGDFELSHLWCTVCDPMRSLCGLESSSPGSDSGFHCPACEEMVLHPCPICGSEAVF